jgi:hypothetical protein
MYSISDTSPQSTPKRKTENEEKIRYKMERISEGGGKGWR